ncbi:MAG: phosphopantetheine-binding protein [Dokdonia sp.]|jgi:acyl carrier protein|nr:acyl carrier protein [Cytophagaceae bacterium]|tara:strand:- start:199 stop:441 length:243 start_codon:yes stop_codon:yes gene_type:complete
MEKHYEELKSIIKIYLPEDVSVDDITPKSHLVNELNINSANLVDVVLDIEEHYDITIEDDEMDKLDTVESAITLIKQKTA